MGVSAQCLHGPNEVFVGIWPGSSFYATPEPYIGSRYSASSRVPFHGSPSGPSSYLHPLGSFRKLGVPYFGALRTRIILFRVLYIRIPHFRKLPLELQELSQQKKVEDFNNIRLAVASLANQRPVEIMATYILQLARVPADS